MTLKKYLTRKFGNKKGSFDMIIYMLRTSFQSSTFKKFWQQWNPLWSYFLIYYMYKPLIKFIPRNFAILITFSISGFFHDCVASIISKKMIFILTPTFLLFGVVILIERKMGFNLDAFPKYFRPFYHFILIGLCATPFFFLKN